MGDGRVSIEAMSGGESDKRGEGARGAQQHPTVFQY